MPTFNGLYSNTIFGTIKNMIISQEVYADNIGAASSELVDSFRTDGTLYGDQKTYYASDCLKSYVWQNDAEAANLLKLFRPADPKVQSIVMNVFRQIPLTVDMYLSKQAWATEGAFSAFTAVMLGWVQVTRRIYDITTFDAAFGTEETAIGNQKITITLPKNSDPEKQARLRASAIAEGMANLLVDLADITRKYNDYGFLRSYSPEVLKVVWNADVVNKIKKTDMPTIFHKDGLIDKFDGEYVLPGRYFGIVNAEGGTTTADNKKVRALHEIDFNTVEPNDPDYEPKKHCFAGDLLPNSTAYEANETYTEDNTVLFKICHNKSMPYMSAFETASEFYNGKSLTENHYLTFGHNTIEHLLNYPMLTVRGVEASK